MITKLSGVLDAINMTNLVVDVNGVGYLLSASAKTLHHLPPVSARVVILVETMFRAEHLELFGFLEEEERDMFKLLLTVQGVGTRVALAIQSALTSQEIIQAVTLQDKTLFTRADGVGPKLAARLTMELKDKVGNLLKTGSLRLNLSQTTGTDESILPAAHEDVLAVLLRLGYRRVEALPALNAALKNAPGVPVEEIVKETLQLLTKGRSS